LDARKSDDLRVLIELASKCFEYVFSPGQMSAAKGLLTVIPDHPDQLLNLLAELDFWLGENETGPKSSYDFASEEARLTDPVSEPKPIDGPAKPTKATQARPISKPVIGHRRRQYASLASVVFLLIVIGGWKYWPFSNPNSGGTSGLNQETSSQRIASQELANRKSSKRNSNRSTKKSGQSKRDASTAPVYESEELPSSDPSSDPSKSIPFEIPADGNSNSGVTPALLTTKSPFTSSESTTTSSRDEPSEPIKPASTMPLITSAQDGAPEKKDPSKIPIRKSNPDAGIPADSKITNSTAVTQESDAVAGLPIASLPDQLSIGMANIKELQSIGTIAIANAADLNLELIYDPDSVGKSRIYFSVEPMAGTGKWDVYSTKREDGSERESVGSFSWNENQFQFQWDGKLDDRSNSTSLVNSVLRLQVGEHVKFCRLRVPVTSESLALDAKTFAGIVSVDVPSAPNEKSLRIEFANLTEENGWPGGFVENPEFGEKKPAVIFFRATDEECLFGIVITRDFNSKLRVSAELHAFQLGLSQPLKLSQFTIGMAEVENQFAFLAAEVERLNAIAADPPYREKTKSEENAKTAKKNLEAARKTRDLYKDYEELVNTLPEREIPFRIVYEFADHVIEIAKSPGFDNSKAIGANADEANAKGVPAMRPQEKSSDEREKK
jgi:hypothetical protein